MRFKRTLFIRKKEKRFLKKRIFGVIPFIKLLNGTSTTIKR